MTPRAVAGLKLLAVFGGGIAGIVLFVVFIRIVLHYDCTNGEQAAERIEQCEHMPNCVVTTDDLYYRDRTLASCRGHS